MANKRLRIVVLKQMHTDFSMNTKYSFTNIDEKIPLNNIYFSFSKTMGWGSEKTRGNKFLSIKKKVHRFQYASVVGEGTMLSRQCIDHRWRRRCLAEKTPATPHAVPEACAILLHLQLSFLEEAEGQGAQVTAQARQSSFQPFYCKSHIYIDMAILFPFLHLFSHLPSTFTKLCFWATSGLCWSPLKLPPLSQRPYTQQP